MKNQLVLLCFAALIGFSVSCKKKEAEEDAVLDAQTKQFNDDRDRYKNGSDGANTDVNTALNLVPSMGRVVRPPSFIMSQPCGYTIDSSQLSQKILFLNFDGITFCGSPSQVRDGQIKVQITTGNHWSEAGAVLTITYINFKVTYFTNNQPHPVIYNGVKTLENVNGYSLLWWTGILPVRYRERALNIQVDFDNGTHATWNSARLTEWSYNATTTNLTFTATGDSTVNGHASVDDWGTNRYGYTFTTYYNQSIVSNSQCGLWKPVSGELLHNVNNIDYTITCGVDNNGNQPVGVCGYGFKVTWTPQGGSQQSVVFSYW
jgi:hypothetical protein